MPEPFLMSERADTTMGQNWRVPDWTARERIAVECFAALIAKVPYSSETWLEMQLGPFAALAFKAADALIEAGREGAK